MQRAVLFLVVTAMVVALLLFNYILGRGSFVAERVSDLNNLQQKQIDITVQMTGLLAGFATLSLGGIAALIWDRKKSRKRPTPQLLAAATGSALSLYFGYLSYRYLLWMLDHRFFDPSNEVLTVTGLLQFCAFFASIVALADFVFVVD